MSFVDGLAEKWERWTPRERRLVIILGLTFIVCVLGLTGRLVQSGLSRLERRNAHTRQALHLLEENRDELLSQKAHEGGSVFEAKAPALGGYLEQIATDLSMKIVESNPHPDATRGKFVEKIVEIKLRNVTVAELAEFLRRVETQSPVVVTQRLYVVHRAIGDKEKLDNVEITVAAFERVAKETKGEAKDKEKEAEKPATEARGG